MRAILSGIPINEIIAGILRNPTMIFIYSVIYLAKKIIQRRVLQLQVLQPWELLQQVLQQR